MSKKNNIIEINGHRYDTTTGAVLSRSGPGGPKTTPKPANQAAVRPAPKAPARKVARQPGVTVRSHAPKPSGALMRQAVKKPRHSAKRHFKAQGHTDMLVRQQVSVIDVKPSVRGLDKKRSQHAKRVTRSQLISHFLPVTANDFKPLPAPPAPKHKSQAPAKPHLKAVPTPAVHHTPKRPKTTAELLEKVLKQADSRRQLPG